MAIYKEICFFFRVFAVFTFFNSSEKTCQECARSAVAVEGKRVNGAGWGECVSMQKQFEESGKNDSLHNKLRKSVNIAKLFSKQNHETEQMYSNPQPSKPSSPLKSQGQPGLVTGNW